MYSSNANLAWKRLLHSTATVGAYAHARPRHASPHTKAFKGIRRLRKMHGYQMMEESSDIWGESPDMEMMDQGYVQGASMNAPSQQYYPYQASAPVPHHYYGGMNQQPQAGSYMQQNYESPGEIAFLQSKLPSVFTDCR
ncbi:hypothetical protein RCO48_25890 [Peribacillus frigoritolerans]|nr:hypothetical protein [Peribacillus frigoritolerans]